MQRVLVTAAAVLGLVSSAFAADYKVEVKSLSAQTTVAVRAEAKDAQELTKIIQEKVGKLVDFLKKTAAPVSGPAYSRYHRYEPGVSIDIEIGIPVEKAMTGEGDVISSELPAGDAATTDHVGAYDKIGDAYKALHTWITDNKKQVNGAPWESYVKQGDKPEENLTQIYYPVK